MSHDENIAEYVCWEMINDPEVFRIAREYEKNPNTLSGKDGVYTFYKMMGMDIEYDEIFAD